MYEGQHASLLKIGQKLPPYFICRSKDVSVAALRVSDTLPVKTQTAIMITETAFANDFVENDKD